MSRWLHAESVHSRHGRGNDKPWITRATRVADVYPRHVNMCIGVVPRKCAQKCAYTWFRPADPVADDLHAVAQRQLALLAAQDTTLPPRAFSILIAVRCPRLCAPSMLQPEPVAGRTIFRGYRRRVAGTFNGWKNW